eukprot:TRINITY_DN4191_c0_g1_i1.p1 TRINITY_DN4191_c0_g1~~TRINITY_DN4191_c0_g1_i1.p1  ORF type:complete len:201 (-),score=60.42 TRINITY_DN4191_c0_g1_i1:137-739(-)
MERILTTKVIMHRAKSDKLSSITKLLLSTLDLTDISAIRQLPNLEIVTLSLNRVSTLRDFSFCPRITELYLRSNRIADISEVKYLVPLKRLRVLWLCGNPCADTPNYRLTVIRTLPSLVKLDDKEVTAKEREEAKKLNTDFEVDGLRKDVEEEKESVRRVADGENRNENVVSAVLLLLKELDGKSLEIVRRDIDRKLGKS